MHVLQISCMRIKDGLHFTFDSGQFSVLPTELPTVSIRESSEMPTPLPTELPNVSIYRSSGQPHLHGKIPMGSPLRCPLFSLFEEVGCPLSCSLFPYMEVVDSLICMVKSHGQTTPLPMGSKVGSSPIFSVWDGLSRHNNKFIISYVSPLGG